MNPHKKKRRSPPSKPYRAAVECPVCGAFQVALITMIGGQAHLDCFVCGRVRYRGRLRGSSPQSLRH